MLKQDGDKGGSASYIAGNVGKDAVKAVIEHIIKANNLLPERSELRFPLMVRSFINGAGVKMRFVLNFSSEEQSFANYFGQVRDLLPETEVTYRAGDTLKIKDWGSMLLADLT